MARFASDLGIKKQVDDQLFALLCYSDIDAGEMTMQTFIEATEEGWWYAARLPGKRLVNMYVTTAAILRRVKADNYAGWASALNSSRLVGPTIARLSLTQSTYHSFPIYSSQLEQVTGKNWLAVGDAASCYDPVASQGLYKALTDGVRAGKAIAAAFANQPDMLTDYATTVKANYQQYFNNRNYLYQQEQRWKEAAFWKERCKLL
jgi:2-polyprenyl-6-methoxyphenol hydroxylase-like FAD-dependent oxidoreductase